MPETRIGLIGSGNMGRAVAGAVMALDAPTCIHSVFDPDDEAISESRKRFGDEFVEAASWQAVVEDPAVDWVMIASWNVHHAAQAIAAFEAGKHVFCQKPLATTLEDCLAMRHAWRRSGRQFVIGFNLRYSPHYRRINSLLREGAIGDLVSFEFSETLDFNHGGFIMGDWRRNQANAGSHLLEKCCHDIDLANWMTGSRASRVASFGGLDFFKPENEGALNRVGKTHSGRQGYMTWRDGRMVNPFTSDKDILDNQVAIIEYENGVRASLHLNSNTAIPERRMYLCGTHGTIRSDVYAGTIELKEIGFGKPLRNESITEGGMHGGGDDVLASELVEIMLNGSPVSTTLDDGLRAAVTCFAIDEAEASGRVVDVGPWWARVDAH